MTKSELGHQTERAFTVHFADHALVIFFVLNRSVSARLA
jgi:hypothetical protein